MKFPYSNFHDLNTDWIIRKIKELAAKVEALGSGGGGGGTSDFNQLSNRPSYNGNTMTNATNVPLVKTAVWDAKQAALVSGTNIKTVNGNSLLGSGNITISGGGGTSDFDQLTNRPSYNSVTMTNATNIPEVKTATWDGKQDALVSGTNIKTINNTSLLGSGNITISGGGGTSDFDQLTNRPSYNSVTMTNATNIPEVKTATWDGKQDALVSGTNIKTINGNTLLGSGDLTISGGGAVDSVNGQTGTVTLTASDVGALASNTTYVSTFNGSSGAINYTAPVTSVNGSTGAVTLNASDVGALASNTSYVSSFNGNTGVVTYTAPVTSVNSQTGAVVLSFPSISTASVTIAVADWNGGTTVTKNVTGVTSSNNLIVSPDPANYSSYAGAVIRATAQGSGTVTFTCDTTPAVDITVNVMVVTL